MLVCIESNSTAQEEFEELCFSFGIELDDVVSACISFSFWLLILKCLISLFNFFFLFLKTTEKAIMRKEKHLDEESDGDEEVIYKIEVPANRYLTI